MFACCCFVIFSWNCTSYLYAFVAMLNFNVSVQYKLLLYIFIIICLLKHIEKRTVSKTHTHSLCVQGMMESKNAENEWNWSWINNNQLSACEWEIWIKLRQKSLTIKSMSILETMTTTTTTTTIITAMTMPSTVWTTFRNKNANILMASRQFLASLLQTHTHTHCSWYTFYNLRIEHTNRMPMPNLYVFY